MGVSNYEDLRYLHGPNTLSPADDIKTLLDKKIEAPVNGYEAYLTSRLIHSLYRSSELKKWVNLSSNLKSKKLGLNN